jgi:hypothetical protein
MMLEAWWGYGSIGDGSSVCLNTVLYENAETMRERGDPHSFFFSDMTSQHRITTTHANLRLQIQDSIGLPE